MDTIYIKLNISKSDIETDKIRAAGMLFENIAEAVGLNRANIKEISENNFLEASQKLKNKLSK